MTAAVVLAAIGPHAALALGAGVVLECVAPLLRPALALWRRRRLRP